MQERAQAPREAPDRVSPAEAAGVHGQPLVALLRSAGNRATGRYIARAGLLARQELRELPAPELIPLPDDPIAGQPQAPSADPRELADWIDRRITQVGFSFGLAGFVLWAEGAQRPMFVPETHFAFDDTPMIPGDKRVYDNWEQAVSALAQGPPAPGAPNVFGFHRGPGATILPTLYTPQTAARTVETARDARQRLIDEFTVEYVDLGIGMAFPRVVAAGLRGVAKVGALAKAKALKKWPGPSAAKPASPGPGKPPTNTTQESTPTQEAPPGARERTPPTQAAEDPRPVVAAAAVRRRLSKFDIRALDPREYVTFRTFDESVARARALEPQGSSNAFVTEEVCFMDGLEGANYGPWHVSIPKADVPGLRSTAAPGEYRTSQPIPAGKGVYYHHDDYLAAKNK